MPVHNGPSADAAPLTSLPAAAFNRLLAEVDDLAEIKVTLFCLAALQQKEGDYRYLRREEFAADAELMRGLARAGLAHSPEETLAAALQKATRRGTLLRAQIDIGGTRREYYFAADEHGRALQARMQAGDWRPAGADEIALLPARPTIYTLYEENIGALTPMMADALKAAEADYPRDWIEAAMRYAVERNVRHWRYISRILEKWQQEGRGGETRGRDLEAHEKYTSGEWQRHIES